MLSKCLAGTELFEKFSEFFRKLLQSVVNLVGFEVNKSDG
jgi:hypothetical protein